MDAIASMNMFDLGGQYLRVGKAITPPNTHYEMVSEITGIVLKDIVTYGTECLYFYMFMFIATIQSPRCWNA